MFQAHVLIIRRSKLHYTASGIITPIGGCLVHEICTPNFDILLTVHLKLCISVINQLDAQDFVLQ